MFLITTDRGAIKKIFDKLKEYFRIDTSVLDTVSDTAKIADILFAVFKDYQVYSNVPKYKLQAVIKSLRLAQGIEADVLSITADLLEKYAVGDANILTFLLAGYASEYVLDKFIDGAKDAYGALLAGHLFLGAKIGEAIVKPLVEGALNTSGINAAAYRAVWACDAADDYLPSYTATVMRFSANPLKYYGEMVESSGTMCRLLSNTVSAVYAFEQSTHEGLWAKFCDWCSGEDIDAKTKANAASVGIWSNYLQFDCDSFYENALRQLSVAKLEWP
jgi:hypothetical protein